MGKLQELILVRDYQILTKIIATWFLVGYTPVAPGTCGAFVAVVLAVCILELGGKILLLVITLSIFLSGAWVSKFYCHCTATRDPPCVIIDEIVGQWLVIFLVPEDLVVTFISFGLFRLFDILKPWPIGLVEGTLHNGWDIMIDDIIAAVYTGLLVCITIPLYDKLKIY